MRDAGGLILWLVGAGFAVVLLGLAVRYLVSLLDLRVFGVQGVLQEVALRRGGRLDQGTILQPYPPLALTFCGLSAVLRIVVSGGVDDTALWLTLDVAVGHTGTPEFTIVQRPRGRRRQVVTTGDSVFDDTWTTISNEARIGDWLLAERLRQSLLAFASRSAVPVAGTFANLLRLRPRITPKTVAWDGDSLRVAEAFQVQSLADIESFLADAEPLVGAFRAIRARNVRG